MKGFIVLGFACISFIKLMGQNLITNPSFEDTAKVIIPSTKFNAIYKSGNQIVHTWFQPTNASSDIFNSIESKTPLIKLCQARTGEGRAGIIVSMAKQRTKWIDTSLFKCDHDTLSFALYTEYLQTKLARKLVKDSVYEVSFYTVLAKNSKHYSKKIGIHFSENAITRNDTKPFCLNPSITYSNTNVLNTESHWQRVKEYYKANGGEQYVTIGRFNYDDIDDLPISYWRGFNPFDRVYYYIDDCAILNVQDTASYYQADREKNAVTNQFVFLLDASASMLSANQFKNMKADVLEIIRKLNPYDNF